MSNQDQDQAGLGEGRKDPNNVVHTLWEALDRSGRFSRFLTAASAAALENILKGPDLHTVFAVSDDVLAKETDEVLRTVIAQHVVHGYQTAADLRTTATVKSFEGPPVSVSYEEGQAKFGDVAIIHADIACTNGMVHEVGRLMKQCAYSG